eukprot:scaffold1671_cov159-Amphora_coffeaeformis.AAC.1
MHSKTATGEHDDVEKLTLRRGIRLASSQSISGGRRCAWLLGRLFKRWSDIFGIRVDFIGVSLRMPSQESKARNQQEATSGTWSELSQGPTRTPDLDV